MASKTRWCPRALALWLVPGAVLVAGGCGRLGYEAAPRRDGGETAEASGETDASPTSDLRGELTTYLGLPGAQGEVDGVGTQARLRCCGVLAITGDVLWVADSGDRLVRVEIPTATAVTVAGGNPDGAADAEVGIDASFADITSITTDGSTAWVTDSTPNHLLRRVELTPPHRVSTVVGAVGTPGATDGVGRAALVDDPRGATYLDGWIYFVDVNSRTLRRLDPATGRVVTLAGTPYETGVADGCGASVRFGGPRAMSTDGSVLYVSDTNAGLLRIFEPDTSCVTTWVGGERGHADGVGTDAKLSGPRGSTTDGRSLFVVDGEQGTVRQVDPATAGVTTLVGQSCVDWPCDRPYREGTGSGATLGRPYDIAYHTGSRSLFVFDSLHAVIARIR